MQLPHLFQQCLEHVVIDRHRGPTLLAVERPLDEPVAHAPLVLAALVLLTFQSLLESLHVLRHLPSCLPIDDEREKKLPDAVTLKVEFDRDTRSIAAVHWLDTPFDIPTNRSVNASYGPRAGRFELSYLRRRCHFAGTGFPGHDDSLADLNGGVVVLDVDDARLPLRQVRRVCHVREDVGRSSGDLDALNDGGHRLPLFSGGPDDVASRDVSLEGAALLSG
jgi:hypothetical protein